MKKYFILLVAATIAVTTLGFNGTTDQDDILPFRKSVMIEKLNLSDVQKKQFSDIIFAHREAVIDMRADQKKNRLAIKKMMMDNEIDADELRRLNADNSALHAQISESRINMWLDVYEILDAEQQEIWAQHCAAMGTRFGERFGNKMGRRGGGMMDGSGPRFEGRSPRR